MLCLLLFFLYVSNSKSWNCRTSFFLPPLHKLDPSFIVYLGLGYCLFSRFLPILLHFPLFRLLSLALPWLFVSLVLIFECLMLLVHLVQPRTRHLSINFATTVALVWFRLLSIFGECFDFRVHDVGVFVATIFAMRARAFWSVVATIFWLHIGYFRFIMREWVTPKFRMATPFYGAQHIASNPDILYSKLFNSQRYAGCVGDLPDRNFVRRLTGEFWWLKRSNKWWGCGCFTTGVPYNNLAIPYVHLK